LFSNLLNSISVTYDQDTNRAGLSGLFACSIVLDMTPLEVRTYFGLGSKCSFTSDATFKINFGQLPTVVVGNVVAIKDLTLQSSSASASLFTRMSNFTVAAPLSPKVPVVGLKASGQSVGRCDDLILDGSSSSGSGGRSMNYVYSVATVSGHGVSNITKKFKVDNAFNGNYGKARVTIDSDSMSPGLTFKVTLTASNFLGYSDSDFVLVEKLDMPAPILSIQGGSVHTSMHSDTLTLKIVSELPTMTCVSTSLSSSKMTFKWVDVSGRYTGVLSGTSKNPRILKIPAGALAADTNYTFKAVGWMTDDPKVNNSATVIVEVGEQDLVATIAGGAFRQAGRDAAFTLVDASTDPDESTDSFTYTWSCANSTGGKCNQLSLGTSSSVTVAAGALEVSTYLFTMTVFKGRRSASTTASVEVVSGAPPVIAVAALTSNKYNADDGFLQVSATASSSQAVSTVWSADGSDVLNLFVSQGVYVSSVSNKLTTVVALSLLTEANTYTLRLTATDLDGSSSYSTVSLKLNEAPSSGSVAVSPDKGYALSTAFEFTAINWVDDDLPFTYLFGMVELTSVVFFGGVTWARWRCSGKRAATGTGKWRRRSTRPASKRGT